MCGIVGCVLDKPAAPTIIESIKKLEYRGYDSVGIATLTDKINVKKGSGQIKDVDNAIKFADNNGSISFKLRVDSKKLIFEIANSGKGIPPDELRYVFERFYKVDKSRSANKSSAGLGLYIVKTIIHAHGGKISVTSKENEFTAFRIILPLSK